MSIVVRNALIFQLKLFLNITPTLGEIDWKGRGTSSILDNLDIASGANLRLNTDDVIQNQERQLNAAKRSILRMLGKESLKNYTSFLFICLKPALQ